MLRLPMETEKLKCIMAIHAWPRRVKDAAVQHLQFSQLLVKLAALPANGNKLRNNNCQLPTRTMITHVQMAAAWLVCSAASQSSSLGEKEEPFWEADREQQLM